MKNITVNVHKITKCNEKIKENVDDEDEEEIFSGDCDKNIFL